MPIIQLYPKSNDSPRKPIANPCSFVAMERSYFISPFWSSAEIEKIEIGEHSIANFDGFMILEFYRSEYRYKNPWGSEAPRIFISIKNQNTDFIESLIKDTFNLSILHESSSQKVWVTAPTCWVASITKHEIGSETFMDLEIIIQLTFEWAMNPYFYQKTLA